MHPFLYMVRHGQTDINARDGLQGHLDAPLNANGRRHAAHLAAYFASRELASIWASPLQRARNTAAAIAAPHGLAVQIDADLIELNYGEIDGLTMDEAARISNFGERDKDRMAYRPPGGETYPEMLLRLGRFFARKIGEPALVVAHQGVMRMAAAHFELLPGADAAMKNFGHQSIITFFRDTKNKVNGHIAEIDSHETI